MSIDDTENVISLALVGAACQYDAAADQCYADPTLTPAVQVRLRDQFRRQAREARDVAQAIERDGLGPFVDRLRNVRPAALRVDPAPVVTIRLARDLPAAGSPWVDGPDPRD